ncbi:hypothetical protein QKU48_gp1081 [Fadolivirus algeromassiliense]|jgi:hypothetical protein|uniref:Uncharacterized protein n=1 Tax=Fadolivirus FV1/VV64 TaxID=3070911 RepID=A0A7D3QWG2_9VIRU|nr:hypothetical protein QKU48_gp1081 [Fadolivirus algeromassiliense]QKF94539.1 hypothetical protein Fadolivirus_1_1081 [Fadolivirus FV1/VV64]
MFSFLKLTQIVTPKTIVTNQDIKDKHVDEIKTMKHDDNNDFKLTNDAVFDAYKENNIEKIKYLTNTFNLKLTNTNYPVDESVEQGNETMAKFLINNFKAQPSLYAKQMATINGHNNIVFWLDRNATLRDTTTDIASVHRHYNRNTKQFEWDECIPVEYRTV